MGELLLYNVCTQTDEVVLANKTFKDSESNYLIDVLSQQLLLVFAFGIHFFKEPPYVLDFIIVTGAISLESSVSNQGGGLVVVLMSWRVARAIHGFAISVKTEQEAVDKYGEKSRRRRDMFLRIFRFHFSKLRLYNVRQATRMINVDIYGILSELGVLINLTYLTFNRTAVFDARSRLIGCRVATVHSLAFQAMNITESEGSVMSDSDFYKFVEKTCRSDIDQFAFQISPDDKKIRLKYSKRITKFIQKTLDAFLQSPFDEKDGFETHWGAKLFHQEIGVPPGNFYVQSAKEVYSMMNIKTNFTYDFVQKTAQLTNANIPGTILLSDESQDLSGSQIQWIVQQGDRRGKRLIFVGDAVQAIYRFRGANPRLLFDVDNCFDLKLTKSFRFGKNIAVQANTLLFTKSKSKYFRDWNPYRLTGNGPQGSVHTACRNGHLFTTDITVIAFKNVTLITYMVDLLSHSDRTIAVNGDGENSGKRKWKKALKRIKELLSLFLGGCSTLSEDFHEFEDENLTWEYFKEELHQRQITNYDVEVNLIERFGSNTIDRLEQIEDILDNPVPKETADVVLSTVHAAKGQEWPNVRVLNDFACVARFTIRPAFHGYGTVRKLHTEKTICQFCLQGAESLNLLYVACTRAMKNLVLPNTLVNLFDCFIIIDNLAQGKSEIPTLIGDYEFDYIKEGRVAYSQETEYNGIFLPPFSTLEEAKSQWQTFSRADIVQLYNQLVVPWKAELYLHSPEGLIIDENVYFPPSGDKVPQNPNMQRAGNDIFSAHGDPQLEGSRSSSAETAKRSAEHPMCPVRSPENSFESRITQSPVKKKRTS